MTLLAWEDFILYHFQIESTRYDAIPQVIITIYCDQQTGDRRLKYLQAFLTQTSVLVFKCITCSKFQVIKAARSYSYI